MEWETRKERRSIVDFDQWHEIKLAKGRENDKLPEDFNVADEFWDDGYCLRCSFPYPEILPERLKNMLLNERGYSKKYPIENYCMAFEPSFGKSDKKYVNCSDCNNWHVFGPYGCPICWRFHREVEEDYGDEDEDYWDEEEDYI